MSHIPEPVFGEFLEMKIKNGTITIEACPSYMDRGRFVVKVFSDNPKEFYIDGSDGFPRYYFRFDNAIDEIILFLACRGQVVDAFWELRRI